MKKIYLNILFVILATFSATAHAEQGAEKPLDAIVEIRISVPENARTAERFGTNRVASGVVIDKTGHILTIGFQTIEAETVKIVGKDHKTVNATVVAYDRNTGFGEGDPVLAASYGNKGAVQGVRVVARKEFAGPWEYLLENAIFTAPPIDFSQLRIADLGLIPTNMFVPIDLLKPILSDLKLSGSSKLPSRPWLGVRTEEIYGHLIVERVTVGGPSEKAGIKPGDIILAVNKQDVHGMALYAFSKVFRFGTLLFIQLLAINTGSLCGRKSKPALNYYKRWDFATVAMGISQHFSINFK
jgi:membrane-associated protease RseP (regulator of RpoE activity)